MNVGGPHGVAVLGMGRSGTSLVAGMFVRAGFFAGGPEDVLGANAGNPHGHHENIRVLNLNEDVLGHLGGWWFSPPPPERQLAAAPELAPRLAAELDRMEDGAHGRPILVKDPRIGALMPVWGSVLRDRLHPVLVVRDPLEIAMSLRVRDGTPVAFGLAMWELHMRLVLDGLNGRQVTVVPHRMVLADPGTAEWVVRYAAAHLDPDLTRSLRPERARDETDPELYRSRAGSVEPEEFLTGRQAALWRLLAGLPCGDCRLDVSADARRPSDLATASVEEEVARVMRAPERGESARALEAERARVAELVAQVEMTKDELHHTSRALAAAVADLKRLRYQFSVIEQARVRVLSPRWRSWRTRPAG